MTDWIAGGVGGKAVLRRRSEEGLGRLGFAACILTWMKPFLSPLYAWASSVRGGTVLKPPLLVSLSLTFILDSLVVGKQRVKCNAPESHIGELFRTDSKGADSFVVLAGWETLKGRSTSEARSFSLRLEEAQVPGPFKEGKGSSWSSKSHELLASMGAVLTGGTDNKSFEALSVKRSSNKLPVMLIRMQLAVSLSSRALKLELRWRR
jgi:hypothetical protein